MSCKYAHTKRPQGRSEQVRAYVSYHALLRHLSPGFVPSGLAFSAAIFDITLDLQQPVERKYLVLFFQQDWLRNGDVRRWNRARRQCSFGHVCSNG